MVTKAKDGWLFTSDAEPMTGSQAAQALIERLDWASWGGPPPPDPLYIPQVCPVCDVVMVSQGLPTDKYRHEH